MVAVVRWKFDVGGALYYEFARNPDRNGGDTGWVYAPRISEIVIIGANSPAIQIDGYTGRRTLRFTAITGTMTRKLQEFFLSKATIESCRDHLYGATSPEFKCFIVSFTRVLHPTIGDFPGSGEDTWDVELTLVNMG